MLVESIVALLGQLKRQGQTIVLGAHDIEVASQAGRVIQMRDGKLMRQS
jgi:ABC-type lipoprotein export system ATPase subunit